MSIPSAEGFSPNNDVETHPSTPQEISHALDTFFQPFFSPSQIRETLMAQRTAYMAPGREGMSKWERAMRHGMDKMPEGEFQDKLRHHLETVTLPRGREHHEQSMARWREKRKEGISSLFITTQNPTKQELLTQLAQDTGVTLLFSHPTALTNEEAFQKVSFMNTASPLEYAGILAAQKEPTGDKSYDSSSQAYLGLDTVVTTGVPTDEEAAVANKPKDTEEAFTMIKDASGKQVSVITGIYFSMPTYEGDFITWHAAVLTSFALRSLSEDQITAYLQENQRALDVSGGIDYASLAGQQLIDPTKNITISYTEPASPSATLSLDPKAAPALTNYFLGVPPPIKKIIAGFPPLYR